MKKILIIILTSFVPYGGLTTVVMNYYRAMDKKNLQIDIASTNDCPDGLKKELDLNNSRYFKLGNRKKNILNYMYKLYKLIKSQKYDVVHVNGNSTTMALELSIAKKCGVNKRIAHTHNSQSNYPKTAKIIKSFFDKSYTDAVAVSKQSGDVLYKPQMYTIMNNAINLKKYMYNKCARDEIRNKYGLSDKKVIGTIGKLNHQKNHTFLLKVLSEIIKIDDSFRLVIVGGGALENELKSQAKNLGIHDMTVFAGMRENADMYLQAFDYFVFPSIFEGLGMAVIEAQCSGLPCFASDCVPEETNVSTLIRYISLDDSPEKWAAVIADTPAADRKNTSESACESIRKNGYDINVEAHKLLDIYLN